MNNTQQAGAFAPPCIEMPVRAAALQGAVAGRNEKLPLREAWSLLHREWLEAHRQARASRQACTIAYAAWSHGKGTGPSVVQLGQAERAETDADELAAELHELTLRLLP